MTHGDDGTLSAYDGEYEEQEILTNFVNGNCPSLIGKPKFFFIQACRGDKHEFRTTSERKYSEQAQEVNAPEIDAKAFFNMTVIKAIHPDVLIMYSCQKGYVSMRDMKSGSWFIQSLCSELQKWKNETNENEILQILMNIKASVSSYYSYYDQTQTPDIVSGLTKTLNLKMKPSVSN